MPTMDVQTQTRFERILLATDFSPAAHIAQAYAVGLAMHDASTLELATVVDLSLALSPGNVIPTATLQSLRRSSEQDLDRLAAHIAGVRVTRKVIEGFQPASLIVDEAVSARADLIVLGTTSKRGLHKLALGSMAEEIIRTGPCPTLTVGPHVPPPATFPVVFQRIVYATDFSSQAAKAADLALSLSQTDGAKLYLCNVVSSKDGSKYADCQARSLSALKALLPQSKPDVCHVECVVEHGQASEAILALAARVDADLIILGARNASFWIDYIHTGLTPALLASATCPVLTVC